MDMFTRHGERIFKSIQVLIRCLFICNRHQHVLISSKAAKLNLFYCGLSFHTHILLYDDKYSYSPSSIIKIMFDLFMQENFIFEGELLHIDIDATSVTSSNLHRAVISTIVLSTY